MLYCAINYIFGNISWHWLFSAMLWTSADKVRRYTPNLTTTLNEYMKLISSLCFLSAKVQDGSANKWWEKGKVVHCNARHLAAGTMSPTGFPWRLWNLDNVQLLMQSVQYDGAANMVVAKKCTNNMPLPTSYSHMEARKRFDQYKGLSGLVVVKQQQKHEQTWP